MLVNENPLDKDFQDLDLSFVPFNEAMPKDRHQRTFFIMRLIDKSMVDGAFVTENLYVSKHVWMQK